MQLFFLCHLYFVCSEGSIMRAANLLALGVILHLWMIYMMVLPVQNVNVLPSLSLCWRWQVHRHYWPVSCKSCRRTFTGSSVSPGLRRFGICDSCNCVTTTHDDSAPVHPASQPEAMERADGGTDWSSFMDDVDEVEVGRVEDLVEKQMLERQLAVCTDVGHTLWICCLLYSERRTIPWAVLLFGLTLAILLLILNCYCKMTLSVE